MADVPAVLNHVARSGRLGQPVFLRLQITCPPERAVSALAEGLAEAAVFFEDVPASLHALGDETSGALQALLRFRSGSCILAYTGPGSDAVDGMLLGNHGAGYAPGAPALTPQRDREAGQLTALLRRSLSTGQPVSVEAEPHA
jgi:hypothetical protein